MSDISITRFEPATASRDKVNAVKPGDNEGGGLGSSGAQNLAKEKLSEEHESRDQDAHEERDAESKEVEQAVSKLNEYVQNVQRDIFFDLDDEAEGSSVTVLDRESQQVLRQFAGKEAVELAKKLDAEEALSLFDAQV